MPDRYLDDSPLWYKDAIIYELHVRTFYDANGDGIGDFKGLARKIDYLTGLGVTCIWLLPFYPSPLRDDGYDISDYLDINPEYGTLKDFKDFLRMAHKSGMKVITELVLNHTSSEHNWFQKARRARPGSRIRNFYVWSKTPDKYRDVRIIFKDFETSNWTWNPIAKAYYWHRFYSHQPDLNFENPSVQKALFRVIDFWLELGVDGMRLDAVPYLYEQEGTNCENLPATHAFLKRLRAHVDSKFKNRMLLAEANQWPEDAAAYFGSGDECHMAFHFPLMPRMFMAVQMEDALPIIDILRVTPQVPDNSQWAIFLRNHDELTLEMVTDQERDYMYRVYAKDHRAKINVGIRRRLAPLLVNNRKKIELMNILLLSLPGTPVIYYGDEIGMGDNYYLGDRNGVRTPMQWSADRNAGFSIANPQQLYLPVIIDPEYHYGAVNVENEERNLSSPLWWMKRVMAMRKRFLSFSRGRLNIVYTDNHKVLVFLREYQDEIMLVAVNLSRFTQVMHCDLSQYAGYSPEEVFSQNRFPVIRKTPYMLTFGPYGYYWLLLKDDTKKGLKETTVLQQSIALDSGWKGLLQGKTRQQLENTILPGYIKTCRWFASKSKTIRKVRIMEEVCPEKHVQAAHLLLIEVTYSEGLPEVYFLPVSFVNVKEGHFLDDAPEAVIVRIRTKEEETLLYDALYSPAVHQSLLQAMIRKAKIKGTGGYFVFEATPQCKKLYRQQSAPLSSRLLSAEQSNTSIVYQNHFILKCYRRLEAGVNVDLEITRYLTENSKEAISPSYCGQIRYIKGNGEGNGEQITLGMLQSYIINEGNAWTYTADILSHYFGQVLTRRAELEQKIEEFSHIPVIDPAQLPEYIRDLIGLEYLDRATLLGRRTALMHRVLASKTGMGDFAPEPFSLLYQRSLYQSMSNLTYNTMRMLERQQKKLDSDLRQEVANILSAEGKITAFMKRITEKKLSAMKIRVHGDYHLGQVLYTGKDFLIIDFEGEPIRSLSERRIKHSAFKDIAGMIRSFHYAAYAWLSLKSSARPEDKPFLERCIYIWYRCISAVYLDAYLQEIAGATFIPQDKAEQDFLLQIYILEKSVYELGYELRHRPEWVVIPIRGIRYLLERMG